MLFGFFFPPRDLAGLSPCQFTVFPVWQCLLWAVMLGQRICSTALLRQACLAHVQCMLCKKCQTFARATGWLCKRNARSQCRHIQQCPLWAVGHSDCQSHPSGLVKVLLTALLCGTLCSIPGLLYSRDVAGHYPLLT